MALSCPGCGTPINQTAEEYYPNGNVRARWTERISEKPVNSAEDLMSRDEAGRENGVRYDYHENGRLSSRRRYLDGRTVGFPEWWWENGNPRTRKTIVGERESLPIDLLNFFSTRSYKSFCEQWYKDGKRSEFYTWVSSASGEYDGIHGLWVGWYWEGQEKPSWAPGGNPMADALNPDRWGDLDFDLEEFCYAPNADVRIRGLYYGNERCGVWEFERTGNKESDEEREYIVHTHNYGPIHPKLIAENPEFAEWSGSED
jgi:YD repeat-containing protein